MTTYRLLNKGETIQEGDEHLLKNGTYEKVSLSVDETVKNNRVIRRPIKGQIIDLPEIPGYEYTGEYRSAKPDEWYAVWGTARKQLLSTDCAEFPILSKIETKPTYRPFMDYDEMKPHRERYVKHFVRNEFIWPLWYTYARHTFYELFRNWTFEDTGEPVGVKE